MQIPRHPRLQRAFEQHSQQLAQAAPAWKMNTESIFNTIAEADPSDDPAFGKGKKLYLPWLLRQMAKGTLTTANIAEVNLALRLFCAQPQAGDLNRFKTPEALIEESLTPARQVIEKYMGHEGTNAQHRRWERLREFPAQLQHRTDFVLMRLLQADPTQGRNLPCIINWLKHPSAPLLPEDLPRLERDMQLHHKHRQQIVPAEKRDLASFETAQQLADFVAPFRPLQTLTPQELERAEIDCIANDDANFLTETEDFRLLHVKTEKGAVRLGQSTEWCTSWGEGDGRENHFESYSDELLYLRSKKMGHALFQLHISSAMFNDAQDKPIRDIVAFFEQHPGLTAQIAKCKTLQLCDVVEETYRNSAADHLPSLFELASLYPAQQATVAQFLPTAFIRYLQAGQLGFVYDALNHCDDHPPLRAALQPHIPDIYRAALTINIAETYLPRVMDFVVAANVEPLARPVLDELAPALIPTLMKEAASDAVTLARLLDLSMDEPDYAPLIEAAAPAAIKECILYEARDKWPRGLSNLLKKCAQTPAHKAATLEVLQTAVIYMMQGNKKLGSWQGEVLETFATCKRDPDYAVPYKAASQAAEDCPSLLATLPPKSLRPA